MLTVTATPCVEDAVNRRCGDLIRLWHVIHAVVRAAETPAERGGAPGQQAKGVAA